MRSISFQTVTSHRRNWKLQQFCSLWIPSWPRRRKIFSGRQKQITKEPGIDTTAHFCSYRSFLLWCPTSYGKVQYENTNRCWCCCSLSPPPSLSIYINRVKSSTKYNIKQNRASKQTSKQANNNRNRNKRIEAICQNEHDDFKRRTQPNERLNLCVIFTDYLVTVPVIIFICGLVTCFSIWHRVTVNVWVVLRWSSVADGA